MNKNYNLTIRIRKDWQQWRLLFVFYLLLLQSVLQQLHPVFDYVDEVFSLIGILYVIYCVLVSGRLCVKKSTMWMACSMLLFLAIGLLGNIIFEYQSWKYVLLDVFTNVKFFLSIISGYILFRNCTKETEKILNRHARFAAVCFFVMLILDQLFQVFPSPEIRYGLRASQLTHSHVTYLAGSMVFLLSIMTLFYEKRNKPYIMMALIVFVFTLRSKAIAGAIVYVLLVYFVLNQRKRIRVWHIALIGVAVLLIAWDQLYFYYYELGDTSARAVMTRTAFQIMEDYFPIGTGFGTYASAVAGESYSRVYELYGFLNIYELGGNDARWGYFSDTFWPIIMGQSGILGLICFLVLIAVLFNRILQIRKRNIYAYTTGLFIFAYILISSTSETAFHNSISIPLAALLGYLISMESQSNETEKTIE